jgi:hypothetical protein
MHEWELGTRPGPFGTRAEDRITDVWGESLRGDRRETRVNHVDAQIRKCIGISSILLNNQNIDHRRIVDARSESRQYLIYSRLVACRLD